MAKVINNETADRVPVGFWHHFVLGKDQFSAVGNKELQERIYQGHLKYYRTVNPDMMKLMNAQSVPAAMAKNMTSEELEGKIITGLIVNKKRDDYYTEYKRIIDEQNVEV